MPIASPLILAETPLPTRHGAFRVIAFRLPGEEAPAEHIAIVCGEVKHAHKVAVRAHSECFTSEVLGSLKCDCREQLDLALAMIARRGCGVVVYLRQEGRGIGLVNKLKAYALQAEGHDTVDANRLLGLPDDTRRYDAAASILAHLGVRSISLMTNNPLKVEGLRALGVEVAERLPMVAPTNEFSAGYLEAKRVRMGHLLPPSLRKNGKHNVA
jgi:GTP cyclohydrolase II